MVNIRNLKPAPDAYVLRYGASILAVLIVLLISGGINYFLTIIVSPLFLAAIFFSAWWGGIRAGFVATFISGIVIDYFFVPPLYDLSFSVDEIIRFIIFSIEGCLFSWLITSRMQITEEISDSREQLQSLSLHQEVLREEERKRIALEIHDELGQSLTGLKMEFHFLNKNFTKYVKESGVVPITDNIQGIQKTIDATVSSVRRIATELRPPIIDDLGLIAALEWQASEFQRRTGISCQLETELETLDINPESAIAVFRIFQESLTNIMRHAEATEIKTELVKKNQVISMCIKDDGIGIREDALKNKTSLGLFGMQERARLVNGELKISHGESEGTLIELTFPLNNVSLIDQGSILVNTAKLNEEF